MPDGSELSGIRGRRVVDLGRGDAAQLGQRAERLDDEGRLVAPAAVGNRRQIGRVGLDQDAVEWRERRRLAHVAGVLEGQDPRERQMVPEIQIGARLGDAAGEAVDDAAGAWDLRGQERGGV